MISHRTGTILKQFPFNHSLYCESVLRGDCNPPGAYAPFIRVDRARHMSLREKALDKKTYPPNIEPLKKRTDEIYFRRLRGVLGLTLNHAQTFFPAYQFLAGEYLNDEWLATVDWHKFHRDHAVHQSMTAYVGMSLLQGEVLVDKNSAAKTKQKKQPEYAIEHFTPGGKTLLDHALDFILRPGPADYLRDYLGNMGAPKAYLEPETYDKSTGKWMENHLTRALWKPLVLDTFFLAALFHDMGYPWKFVSIIHDNLEPHSPSQNPGEQTARWLADTYEDRLVFYPFTGYRKDRTGAPADWRDRLRGRVLYGNRKTHGLPGAISFLHLNDILRRDSDEKAWPVRRFCVEWAAMAIMMHDMSGLYGKVDEKKVPHVLNVKNPQMRLRFGRDPLSAVLTLSDLIQEFSRPDAHFTRPDDNGAPDTSDDDSDNSMPVECKYFNRCKGVELDWDDTGTLTIKYIYRNVGDCALKKKKFIPVEQLLYFDPKHGYLDFSDVGIERIVLDAECQN